MFEFYLRLTGFGAATIVILWLARPVLLFLIMRKTAGYLFISGVSAILVCGLYVPGADMGPLRSTYGHLEGVKPHITFITSESRWRSERQGWDLTVIEEKDRVFHFNEYSQDRPELRIEDESAGVPVVIQARTFTSTGEHEVIALRAGDREYISIEKGLDVERRRADFVRRSNRVVGGLMATISLGMLAVAFYDRPRKRRRRRAL